MVRAETYKVYGDTIKYLIKNTKQTLNYLSLDIGLDTKTIQKSMRGEQISKNVIIKFCNYFGVPISFFSDFKPNNLVTLNVISDWEKYVRDIDTDSDFNYFFDKNIESKLLKNNLPLFEEFISQLTSSINENKENNVFQNEDDYLDVSKKLDKLKKFKESFKIIDTIDKISKNFIICVGRHNIWKFDDSTLEYFGHVVHTAYKRQLIHFKQKNTDVPRDETYTVGIANSPPNPSKIWFGKDKFESDQDELIHNCDMWLDYKLGFRRSQFFSKKEMEKIINNSTSKKINDK